MPRTSGPATIRDLERLHRNSVRAINREFARLSKAKEPVPANLLSAATALLKATGVVEPRRTVKKGEDRLGGLLKDYITDEANLGDTPQDMAHPLVKHDNGTSW